MVERAPGVLKQPAMPADSQAWTPSFSNMQTSTELTQPTDICLLLRAHAEQRWLDSELVPQLQELEHADAIPDEQIGAALAYLEVLWLDAHARAANTDAAYRSLEPGAGKSSEGLHERARRYYLAVRTLRSELYVRVRHLMRLQSHELEPSDQLANAERPRVHEPDPHWRATTTRRHASHQRKPDTTRRTTAPRHRTPLEHRPDTPR